MASNSEEQVATSNQTETNTLDGQTSEENTLTARQMKNGFFPKPEPIEKEVPIVAKNDSTLSVNASVFVPTSSEKAPSEPLQEKTKVETDLSKNQTTVENKTQLIYDLNKYKYDYLISKLSIRADGPSATMGTPYGLCSVNDEKLLVAAFDRDSIILTDLSGSLHNVYKNLSTPKDVQMFPNNPSQALVSLQKGLAILDIERGQVIKRSTQKAFYPWKIQRHTQHSIFLACDPGGEEILFIDENLDTVGKITYKDSTNQGNTSNVIKHYPYAGCFTEDNILIAGVRVENKCHLLSRDIKDQRFLNDFELSSTVESYSVHALNGQQYIVADKLNDSLILVENFESKKDYRWPSVRKPFGMAFLTNGIICVSCHGSSPEDAGIAVLSETNLKNK